MKRWIVVAAVALVGVVTLVWFQPQKLFIDDTVSETAPSAAPAATEKRMPTGEFKSLAHATSGRAIVHETADGSLALRLEDFETENGPDLRVYLSSGEPYGKDFIDLGGLKGNLGNQNYEIPKGTDVEKYDNAVVWCRRFTVGFGVAQLS